MFTERINERRGVRPCGPGRERACPDSEGGESLLSRGAACAKACEGARVLKHTPGPKEAASYCWGYGWARGWGVPGKMSPSERRFHEGEMSREARERTAVQRPRGRRAHGVTFDLLWVQCSNSQGKVEIHKGPELQAKGLHGRLEVGHGRALSRGRQWSRFSVARSLWGQMARKGRAGDGLGETR